MNNQEQKIVTEEDHNQVQPDLSSSDLAKRLEIDKRSEERLHMLTKREGDMPIIHTMESDSYDNIRKGNIDKIKILSGQMDTSQNSFAANGFVGNKKMLIISLIAALSFISIAGAGLFYFFVYKKPVAVEEVKLETPKYTILDVWNDPQAQSIFSNTTEATSTQDSITIKIDDFDPVYKAILSDETIFANLARSKFKFYQLGSFSDLSVKDIKMRVSDGESGAFVYGYVDKNYMIMASSVSRFLELYNSLKK
jgi:flagellar basal body-associated protein FliL